MSLWSAYYEETWGREIIEESWGFIMWHYEGEICFLDEIYVVPEERTKGRARELCDRVTRIAQMEDKKKLICAVWPEQKVSSVSMSAALAYGFKLHSNDGRRVLLIKDLEV